MDTNNAQNSDGVKDTSPTPASETGQTDTTQTDASHLASQVVVAPKKSHKKLIAVILILVVVLAAAGAGAYWYMTTQNNDTSSDESQAAATPKPSETPKTLEEQATAALEDGIKKETELLEKSDDTEYIKNSTAAATSVGGDLNEQDLED